MLKFKSQCDDVQRTKLNVTFGVDRWYLKMPKYVSIWHPWIVKGFPDSITPFLFPPFQISTIIIWVHFFKYLCNVVFSIHNWNHHLKTAFRFNYGYLCVILTSVWWLESFKCHKYARNVLKNWKNATQHYSFCFTYLEFVQFLFSDHLLDQQMWGTAFLMCLIIFGWVTSLTKGLCCHLNAQDVMQHCSLSNWNL